MPPVIASAVFPGRRRMPAHTRAFVDALVAKFAAKESQTFEEVKLTKARLREKPPQPRLPAELGRRPKRRTG